VAGSKAGGQLRIVAGDLRGRRLEVPAGSGVRPTGDRARQALFNLLEAGRLTEGRSPVPGAVVLDAFAGSGALGFEALSRGAAQAFFIESDPTAAAVLARNIAALGLEGRARLLRADAFAPPRPEVSCGLAFLDPPYGRGLGPPALAALLAAGWLAPGALVSLEVEKTDDPVLPPGFLLLEERRWGRAKVLLARAGQEVA